MLVIFHTVGRAGMDSEPNSLNINKHTGLLIFGESGMIDVYNQ